MNTNFENTPRVLATALGTWALAVVAGSVAGAFAVIPMEEIGAIAVFGFVFAVGAAWLDRGVRELIVATRTGTLVTIAIEADLAIVAAVLLVAGFSEGAVAPMLRDFLASMATLFLAPVAAALHVVIAERLLAPRPAPLKQPAAKGSASLPVVS